MVACSTKIPILRQIGSLPCILHGFLYNGVLYHHKGAIHHSSAVHYPQAMIHPLLQELGLSPNEAKIYEALLTYGGSGVSTISLRAQVHRRNAYDAVQRLLQKGLVFEVHGKGEVVYEAVEPGKLMEFLKDKETRLTAALPQLQKLFHTNQAPELAYIFKGVEGVKNYMREALRLEQDMFVLGAEGAWLDPRIRPYTEWFLSEATKRDMKIRAIFDCDAKEITGVPEVLSHEHKYLPEQYDTNATMDIFGDYVVTYTGTAPGKLLEDVTIFVLYSPQLAHSYRIWWQMIWDLLPAAEDDVSTQLQPVKKLKKSGAAKGSAASRKSRKA